MANIVPMPGSPGKTVELAGPLVPEGFVDDGCTKSPDGWWVWACRIHDYEYQEIRLMKRRRKKLRPIKDRELRASIKREIVDARFYADYRLKRNIRLLSSDQKDRAIFAWFLSRRYHHVVRVLGWFAVRGPGHAGN